MIKDSNQNKKPLIFYMAVAVIVIMLLNAFVFPMLLQRQVQEVGYSDFLKMVDSKQISEVSMDENGEGTYVAGQILANKSRNIPLNHHAILYRTNPVILPMVRFLIQYNIPLVCTAEMKKINGDRRPILDDIRECVKIKYEAKAIILVYNEVHYKGESSEIFFNRNGYMMKQPVLELHFAKNKISSFKGRLFYEFYPELFGE
mgnify:CR=1 FL=1